MKNTSLGVHTIGISTRFTGLVPHARQVAWSLYETLKKTEGIRVRPEYEPKRITLPDGTTRMSKPNQKVEHIGGYKGVRWLIRMDDTYPQFQYHALEATLNPKILSGEKDYIAAGREIHLENIGKKYDCVASETSDKLPLFKSCRLNRADFCVNFDTKEMGYHQYDCTTKQLIMLIERADIPVHYEELLIYDTVSHRRKSPENQLYLKSDSVHINCYWKSEEQKNKYKNHPDIDVLDIPEDVIRFETQYHPRKIYPMRMALIKKYPLARLSEEFIIKRLLSDENAKLIVVKEFNRFIKPGNYYTLQNAVNVIRRCGFRVNKEARLIGALKYINDCRGIGKARHRINTAVANFEPPVFLPHDFNRTLLDLAEIGINPVTIPREWGIGFLPGLMNRYLEMTEGVK